MTKNNIKDIIDFELRQIKLTDQIKNNVRKIGRVCIGSLEY